MQQDLETVKANRTQWQDVVSLMVSNDDGDDDDDDDGDGDGDGNDDDHNHDPDHND